MSIPNIQNQENPQIPELSKAASLLISDGHKIITYLQQGKDIWTNEILTLEKEIKVLREKYTDLDSAHGPLEKSLNTVEKMFAIIQHHREVQESKPSLFKRIRTLF